MKLTKSNYFSLEADQHLGEIQGRSKLTESKVVEILEKLKLGERPLDLGKKYYGFGIKSINKMFFYVCRTKDEPRPLYSERNGFRKVYRLRALGWSLVI